ncbi:unnamed protein product [Gordionus sp. m RMFG-2023]
MSMFFDQFEYFVKKQKDDPSKVLVLSKLVEFLSHMARKSQINSMLNTNCVWYCNSLFYKFMADVLDFLSNEIYPSIKRDHPPDVEDDEIIDKMEANLPSNIADFVKSIVVSILQILHFLTSRLSSTPHIHETNFITDNPLKNKYCHFYDYNKLLVLLYDALFLYFPDKEKDLLHRDMILDLIEPLMSQEEISKLIEDENDVYDIG